MQEGCQMNLEGKDWTELIARSRQGDREAVEQFSGAAPTVTAIGGCYRSVSLRECIHGGYFAGRNIEYY